MGGRCVERGQTYRRGPDVSTGDRPDSGAGVSAVGWAYQWWDGRINGGMGILMAGWAY